MRDLIGLTLDHYRIVEKIGEGGMGMVYRAHDETLDRDVAIKVLPEEVAQDADRLARFEHEARAVAKLNHPNILAIHDFEAEGEITFAVTELLEGESLRERLLNRSGPLPWRRTREIGAAVATGLGAAHHKGIVHRDIKPENIFLVNDGRVKILDFGLAQVHEPVDANADTATLTPAGTVPGSVMGTVGYMSPEQVRGEPADARSDIFALGCVLFEMLAGHQAFKRETTAEIMAAILREDPPSLVEFGIETAPEVEKTIQRCLEKNPERRYQSARDLAFAVESLSGTSAPVAPVESEPSTRSRSLPLIAAALAVLSALLVVLLWQKPTGADLSTYRFSPFATGAEPVGAAAWSYDGRSIAYVKRANGRSNIFVRSLDSDSPVKITDFDGQGVDAPFWSPDGSRVWFRSGGRVMSVGRAGGEPELAQDDTYGRAGDLSPDGRTLATWRSEKENGVFSAGVWLADPPTATPRKYEPAPFEITVPNFPVYLKFSPDGTQILASFPGSDGVEVWLLPFPDGEPASGKSRKLFSNHPFSGSPEISWMPDGRRVVMAFRENLGSRAKLWMGDIRDETVRPLTAGVIPERAPDVSPDGLTIAFNSIRSNFDIVEVQLDGSPLRDLLTSTQDVYSAAWVPGKDRFAYMTSRNGRVEIRVRSRYEDWDRTVVSQKDFPDDVTRIMRGPIVSPNGSQIAFDRQPENGLAAIWISPTAGGAPTKLVETIGAQYGPDWGPDGKWLSFLWAKGGAISIAKVRVGSSDPPQTLVDGNLVASLIPAWSPTGEWIVYFGRNETETGLRLIDAEGTTSRFLADIGIPAGWVWSRDGETIYTIKVDSENPQLLAIDIETGAVTSIGQFGAENTFQVPFSPGMRFTLAPDGKSFSASVYRIDSDLWLLEGFDPKRNWLDRFR